MENRKIYDMHCDTLCTLTDMNISLDNNVSMVNLETLKNGNVDLMDFACFAIYTKEPYKRVKSLIETYHKMLKEYPFIKPVLKKEDLEYNGFKTLLSIEEGGALEGNFDKLEEFYQDGVRLITLTWNFENEIAYPNNVRENIPNINDGIKEFGKDLIKKMNELGIIIDISHLGDKGTQEVLELSEKPVMASHSCARSITNHVRNMTDDLLKLLIKNRGFIGINFCKDFITNDEFGTVDDIIKHIDYIKSLGGIDSIGFGSDFDGISNKDIEMKDSTIFNTIIDRLKLNGYTDEEIDKITHLNAKRVIFENLK